MTEQWIYSFGSGHAEGRADMRALLGGKGANLAEMSSLGLPVPPGFTITTEVCNYFYENERKYPDDLVLKTMEALVKIEAQVGAIFGHPQNPLLLSVRSGARVSMPGMMDTVLNLGLNDITVVGLAQKSGDGRFAWDSYRRFIQMYGDVVMGVPHSGFEEILDQYKRDHGYGLDTEMLVENWQELILFYKEYIKLETGDIFPQEPQEQLWGAIEAVFDSWMTPRAVTYRKINNIPEEWGTAVTVQAMVFGNMGQDSSTGVAFTRDPSTGENYFYGEYLINAQGEDVVAGIRTPQPLSRNKFQIGLSRQPSMEETMPEVYAQLKDVRKKLEGHFKDMQDIEFTVQRGKLYMLQTRSGKRTAAAALKIAVDMVAEGLISIEDAVMRVDASALDQLLHPTLDPNAKREVVARGLPASPGAACGIAVLTADEAEEKAKLGEAVILVRTETSPEDIHGMHVAKGILTSRGGMTSHAAVVARGMGRACVAGASQLHIDMEARVIYVGPHEIRAGDVITIDGSTGEVMLGKIPTVKPNLSGDFETIMEWANEMRRMKVRANAETPEDARVAREFGAEGIGLCRTEHMFFEPSRIQNVREMIFAENGNDRKKALQKLLPEQQNDFKQLFQIMRGLPVTIRLLDPPLHEFLPQKDEDIETFALLARLPVDQVRRRLSELHESNPMLGHRGCRLGVTYPEIYEMQVLAIFEAAVEANGIPEIMVPLVGMTEELKRIKAIIDNVAEEIFVRYKKNVSYTVGTMIELPRAALIADEIARDASFFSFGTNDLTQTTLGMSRDDAGAFLPFYIEKGILSKDPFVTIDEKGVGKLIEMATMLGRRTRPTIKVGICGEHGGDPQSIMFCESVGLDYISCSPYRVPIARLAAAQAAIKARRMQTHQEKAEAAE